MTPAINRIVVPTDFSVTSDAAIEYAKALAERFGASLHLIHVFEDPYMSVAFATDLYVQPLTETRDALRIDAEARLRKQFHAIDGWGVDGTADVIDGVPAQAIVDYADRLGADLIVMGTHGRSGFAHLMLGSVAERVLRTAPCPVLTVRAAVERAVRCELADAAVA